MLNFHRRQELAKVSSGWAFKVLRLFQLYTGDQETAEALTINAFAESVRLGEAPVDDGMPLHLLRRACATAEEATTSGVSSTDPLVRSLAALTADQRRALVLFRGVGLEIPAIARVMGADPIKVKRLCIDALLRLRDLIAGRGGSANAPS